MYYNWSAFKSQNDQSRHAWEPWGTETSSHSAINYPLNHSLFNYSPPPPPAGGVSAAMMNRGSSPFLVGGEGENGEPCIYYNLDPHLMCLKLGKRQYFEDVTGVTSSTPIVIEEDTAAVGHGVSPVERKGKTSYGDSPPMAPRCQVEGCETGLVNAKDYHRRHKVCQMHAKAPKVVVLGIAQRFCQQCSRFHAVEQFDDSKRSCRRRLAGHNERRRKSSLNQPHLLGKLQQGLHHPDSSLSNSECALSLLSSGNIYAPWNPTASQDLPARCSAALRDLIAENRASRQLVGTFNPGSEQRQSLTLDLMLDPNSPFGHLSNRLPSAEGRENGGDFWKVTSQY